MASPFDDPSAHWLADVQGYIFDLDGTIYLGDEPLPGAVALIAQLRAAAKGVLFVSNKPLEPRAAYAAKLTRLGMPTSANQVITSAHVLGVHLAATAPDLAYYVLGEESLVAELRGHGLRVVEETLEQDARSVIDPRRVGTRDAPAIDAVIVAFDRTLTYRKLNTAYQALQAGARYFATNGDKTCPLPGGAVPDAGAIIAYLATLTGRTPELVAGKPSPLILETALAQLGLPAHQCLMVGDRLETDIRMGQLAGMSTAAVLTGVCDRDQATAFNPPPTLILNDLHELATHLQHAR